MSSGAVQQATSAGRARRPAGTLCRRGRSRATTCAAGPPSAAIPRPFVDPLRRVRPEEVGAPLRGPVPSVNPPSPPRGRAARIAVAVPVTSPPPHVVQVPQDVVEEVVESVATSGWVRAVWYFRSVDRERRASGRRPGGDMSPRSRSVYGEVVQADGDVRVVRAETRSVDGERALGHGSARAGSRRSRSTPPSSSWWEISRTNWWWRPVRNRSLDASARSANGRGRGRVSRSRKRQGQRVQVGGTLGCSGP
jgi:hypothetical protein